MNFLSVNPVFLFIIFALGYVFGLLLKNPTAGKFIIFGFFGVFIYQPVRDAGLLATALFLAGILAHHMSLLSILDHLPRLERRRDKRFSSYEDESQQEQAEPRQKKKSESAEETHRKYEEYVNEKRSNEAGEAAQKKAGSSQSKRKQSDFDTLNAKLKAMKQEKERMEREQDRIKAEREKFNQEQASHSAPDERTHEEVLGLTGRYSLDDLKKARSREAKRWNTSNMVNKPKHLVKQAEEEMKMINLAFAALKKQFP